MSGEMICALLMTGWGMVTCAFGFYLGWTEQRVRADRAARWGK